MEEEGIVPRWLTALIHAQYSKCKGLNNTDLRYCCLDCASESMTIPEREKNHPNHHVIEGYKCSKFYGYNIYDIHGLKEKKFILDASDIVEYTINSLKIYFPKSRLPYKCYKTNYGDHRVCFTCGWKKADKVGFFCSILCKLMYQARDDPQKLAVLVESLILSEKDQIFKDDSTKKMDKKAKREEEMEYGNKPVQFIDNGEKSSCLPEKLKLGGGNGGGLTKEEENKGKKSDSYATEVLVESSMRMEHNQVTVPKISSLKRMAMEDERKERKKAMEKKKATRELQKEKSCSLLTKVDVNGGNAEKKEDSSDDNKLQCLIDVAVTDSSNMKSFRKRSRKGIPCRSPSNCTDAVVIGTICSP